MVTLVVVGSPAIKKNRNRVIRVKGRPFIIPSKKAVDWEKDAVSQLKAQWRDKPPIEGPLSATLHIHLSSRQNGDMFNYDQAPLDALQEAGVIQNDRQFQEGHLFLHKKSGNPRVEITVSELVQQPITVFSS